MTLKLQILPRAQEVAQCMYNYINKRSPQGAVDWWLAFESAAIKATFDFVGYPLLSSVKNL